MITQVEARTQQGTLLTLSLEDVVTGFVVQNIDGLDPVKATIVSSSFAQMDGVQYQSSKRDARNVVMTLGLEPDYGVDTVRDLRSRLYNFFMPKTPVSLRFYMDDGLQVDIDGRVESCDSPIFTQEPKADISIMCFDPDFVDVTPVEIAGSTVSSTANTHIEYLGTAETGFIFALNVDRALSEFTIYNRPPDGIIRTLDFSAALVAGDVLTISTIAGDRSVTLNRAGVESSLLYGMPSSSDWVEFMPGDNYLRVYALGDPIPYEISYTTRYGGL